VQTTAELQNSQWTSVNGTLNAKCIWVYQYIPWFRSQTGIISSRNSWEQRSQSYFDNGNGVPRNTI